MPHLVEVQDELHDGGLVVLGITDAGEDEVRGFVEEHGINFPVLANAAADREAYGVSMIWGSVFYLVDPDGRIVESGLADSEERARDELAR